MVLVAWGAQSCQMLSSSRRPDTHWAWNPNPTVQPSGYPEHVSSLRPAGLLSTLCLLSPETSETCSCGWKRPTHILTTCLCLPGLSFFKFYYINAETIISPLQTKNSSFYFWGIPGKTSWHGSIVMMSQLSPILFGWVWTQVNPSHIWKHGSILRAPYMCFPLSSLLHSCNSSKTLDCCFVLSVLTVWSGGLTYAVLNATPLSYTHNSSI